MIVNLKELSSVISQLTDLVAGDKTVPGIMFNIGETEIEVCYSDGNNKVFSEKVSAEIGEDDIKEKIIFNYQALTKIIEACKPTGKIITDTIEFEFCANNIIKIKAEKKIPLITNSEDGETSEKVVSVTEQTIGWTAAAGSSARVAALTRGNYDLLHHFDDVTLAEKYPDEGVIKPLSTSDWEAQSDCWDLTELKSVLAKLSIENGKLVYVAPTLKKAFVQNTSCVICIPIESDIKHKIIQSTSLARALSTILGKINAEDNKVYTHMLDNDAVVYSTEDSSTAISLRNTKQDNSNIIQLNNCLGKDYTQYMLNFNREVLQSCLYSAKTAGASDKIVIGFERYTETVETDTGEEVEVSKVKLLMTAKNTNSSTDNKYDVMAEYALDNGDNIDSLKLNVTLDILHQAVSKAETDYIALDVHVAENKTKMVRVSEINLDKRKEISEANGISGSWTAEFMAENRDKMLGYTTYFTVGAE